jgi:hypothetical protein
MQISRKLRNLKDATTQIDQFMDYKVPEIFITGEIKGG